MQEDLAGDRPADVINACIAYNAVYATGAYPAGALVDRLPQHLIFALGLVVLAAGHLGLGLVHACWLVFVLLPLYGGFAAWVDGVGQGVGLQPVPGFWTGLGPGPVTRR